MCGLVSIIPRNPQGFYASHLDLLEQMLILDQLRGKDSAGAMTATRSGDAMVIKHATRHVTLMFETKEWNKFRQKAIQGGRFVVGHNRAATRGAPNSDNAHPFVEGRIMLAHNGTLDHSNIKELSPNKEVTVDSNAIAVALNEDTPDNVIPRIQGAFALIWYNNEDETLYAVRNDQRPLHLITTKDFYFLMSEPWMMMSLWARMATSTKVEDMAELKPGELLSFDLTGKLARREVVLSEKKTGGSTTQDTYARSRWQNHLQQCQSKFSDCTRETVETGAQEIAEDPLEDDIPFDQGLTGDPEEKRIRNVLTVQALRKAERERSAGCALTQNVATPMLTSTTKSDSIGKSSDGTTSERTDGYVMTDVDRYCEQQMANQRNIIVQNPEFQPGTFLLVKVMAADLAGKFWKWTGKVRSPGKPMLDACGVLPEGTMYHNLPSWIGQDLYATGRVKFCTQTTSGPSVFVEYLKHSQSTDIYADDIPWAIWNYALMHCQCSGCHGRVFDWERPFTRVTTKGEFTKGVASPPRNKVNVVCPDCLMKVLPDGEIYDSYTKQYYEEKARSDIRAKIDRFASVQDRKPVGGEPVGKNGSIIVVPGSSTLQ